MNKGRYQILEIHGQNADRILLALYFPFPGEMHPLPCGHPSVKAYLAVQQSIAIGSKNIAANVEAINEQVSYSNHEKKKSWIFFNFRRRVKFIHPFMYSERPACCADLQLLMSRFCKVSALCFQLTGDFTIMSQDN